MQGKQPERHEHEDLNDDDGDVGAGHPVSIAAHRPGGGSCDQRDM